MAVLRDRILHVRHDLYTIAAHFLPTPYLSKAAEGDGHIPQIFRSFTEFLKSA